MRKFNKTQRNYMIIGLCSILVIMAAGYAAFASQLRISGTSSINSNFLVKITNIAVSDKVGSASDKTDITTYNDTSATFGVSLVSPGDSITYDITIANQGTIDAVLKLITKTDTNNSAILFETSGVNEGDELKAGQTTTMKVKVTYNSSVTSQPNNLESNLTLTLDYEQTGGSVTPPPTIKTSEDLKALAVTTGDGLYADEYEGGERYVYKGGNPNNYIIFNDETWRILAVEADGALKIMRNESIGDMEFDTANSCDIAYNSISDGVKKNENGSYEIDNIIYLNPELPPVHPDHEIFGDIKGCIQWERPATLNNYLNGDYLDVFSNIDLIVQWDHRFAIGEIFTTDNLQDTIEEEMQKISSDDEDEFVGLMSVSDYIRADSNIEQCGTIDDNSLNANGTTCYNTNFINASIATSSSKAAWTISRFSSDMSGLIVSSDGSIKEYYAGNAKGIFPVAYLVPDVSLSGTGTSVNPYEIMD